MAGHHVKLLQFFWSFSVPKEDGKETENRIEKDLPN